MSMTFEEFHREAQPVKQIPDNELYRALALNEEAGEVAGVQKKIVRDRVNQDPRAKHVPLSARLNDMLEECGDTLFYLKLQLEQHGFTLDDAAAALLQKLERMRMDLRASRKTE